MRINSSSNNHYNNVSVATSFRSRDYFLKIKQLPNMTCGCCGKKTLNVNDYVNTLSSLSKPLSYLLDCGKFNYVRKYYPNAWDTLTNYATEYPDSTLDEIVRNQEKYVQLKKDIAQKLETPEIEENTKERHYLDRRIGGRFFDLLARGRCVMENSSKVIKELVVLKPYIDGLKKEAFEILEEYSTIYPEKTLSEIIKEVHEIHDKRGAEYKKDKIQEIEDSFSKIEKLAKYKGAETIQILDSLSEQSWEILRTELDPKARQYKIKNLYTETLSANNCADIIPDILMEVEKIPMSVMNVDTFFTFAYKQNFDDEKIIRTIFNPIIGSEEHIVTVADNGADRIGNKAVLCKECNNLRKVSYSKFVEYHPEMIQNMQKQMDIVTNSILNDTLSEDYRFYPYTIAQTFKTESEGKINLDIIQYSKEIIKRSKRRLAELEKEIERICDVRDARVCDKTKSKDSLSKEINEINQEIQALRDKIWSEKNLQTIANNYLKGVKK